MLEDIRVLDFGQAFFAPVAVKLLSHLGMDVIKVEPLEGDFQRITGTRENSDSASFLQVDMNRRSLAINLREKRGMEIILKLIKESDVIVQNFRVGGMGRLGLDYESVSKINPRIVYCSASMYGETGPRSRWRGGDPWAQAMTGMVAVQGSPGGSPYLAGTQLIDYQGAALAAFAIMAALYMRERTGVGQEVCLNLLNAGVFIQQVEIADYLIDGVLHKKVGRGSRGAFPYGAYRASDGDVVTIFGQDDAEWPQVCSILGIEWAAKDPRYDTRQKRRERRFELYPILDEAFSKKTRAEWQEIFLKNHLRCDPCLDYAELVNDPQFKENGMLIEVDHPRDGKLKVLGSPIKFSGSREPPVKPAPVLGEHTKEILLGLGYTENEISTLENDGVIGVASTEMVTRKP